ncbi:hypothetical protein GVAV_003442 [Gurleya vavrai]
MNSFYIFINFCLIHTSSYKIKNAQIFYVTSKFNGNHLPLDFVTSVANHFITNSLSVNDFELYKKEIKKLVFDKSNTKIDNIEVVFRMLFRLFISENLESNCITGTKKKIVKQAENFYLNIMNRAILINHLQFYTLPENKNLLNNELSGNPLIFDELLLKRTLFFVVLAFLYKDKCEKNEDIIFIRLRNNFIDRWNHSIIKGYLKANHKALDTDSMILTKVDCDLETFYNSKELFDTLRNVKNLIELEDKKKNVFVLLEPFFYFQSFFFLTLENQKIYFNNLINLILNIKTKDLVKKNDAFLSDKEKKKFLEFELRIMIKTNYLPSRVVKFYDSKFTNLNDINRENNLVFKKCVLDQFFFIYNNCSMLTKKKLIICNKEDYFLRDSKNFEYDSLNLIQENAKVNLQAQNNFDNVLNLRNTFLFKIFEEIYDSELKNYKHLEKHDLSEEMIKIDLSDNPSKDNIDFKKTSKTNEKSFIVNNVDDFTESKHFDDFLFKKKLDDWQVVNCKDNIKKKIKQEIVNPKIESNDLRSYNDKIEKYPKKVITNCQKNISRADKFSRKQNYDNSLVFNDNLTTKRISAKKDLSLNINQSRSNSNTIEKNFDVYNNEEYSDHTEILQDQELFKISEKNFITAKKSFWLEYNDNFEDFIIDSFPIVYDEIYKVVIDTIECIQNDNHNDK